MCGHTLIGARACVCMCVHVCALSLSISLSLSLSLCLIVNKLLSLSKGTWAAVLHCARRCLSLCSLAPTEAVARRSKAERPRKQAPPGPADQVAERRIRDWLIWVPSSPAMYGRSSTVKGDRASEKESQMRHLGTKSTLWIGAAPHPLP